MAESFAFCRYRFKSGNLEFPSDKFYNTSIKAIVSSTADQTDVILGEFNHLGIAEGVVDSDRIGLVKEIQFLVRSDSVNWVILSEVRGDKFNLLLLFFWRYIGNFTRRYLSKLKQMTESRNNVDF